MEPIQEEDEALEDLIEEAPQEEFSAVAVMSRMQVTRQVEGSRRWRLQVKDDHELVTLTHTKYTRTHAHNPHNLGTPCIHCNPTKFQGRNETLHTLQPDEISTNKYDVANKKQIKVVSYQIQLLKFFW